MTCARLLKWLLCLALVVPPAYAAEVKEDKDTKELKDNEVSQILDSMGYPELQVVPRASERLRIEAKEEQGGWFLQHWQIQFSGLLTLGVGLTSEGRERENLSAAEDSDAGSIRQVTQAVGAGWLIGGLILGLRKPYRAGFREISKYPGKDDRAALTRERLAEEALERPAKAMRVLKHVSVGTNFLVNGLTMIHANDEGKVIAGVAAILAFLPYMFEDYTIAVYNKHIEYKKKIYAPLKSASVHFDPQTKTLTPVTNLTWTF